MVEDKSFLSEDEIQTLVLSLGASREGDTFTEDEIMIVLRWAEEIEIGYALLQNVLQGTVKVDVKEGEVYFNLTDKGKNEVEMDMLMHPNPQSDLVQ